MPDFFFRLPYEIPGHIECISAIFTPFAFSCLSSRWWVQLFAYQERFVRQLPLKSTVLWGCLVYERQKLFLNINLGCFDITWGRCTVSFSVEVAVYILVIVEEYRPSGRLQCSLYFISALCNLTGTVK